MNNTDIISIPGAYVNRCVGATGHTPAWACCSEHMRCDGTYYDIYYNLVGKCKTEYGCFSDAPEDVFAYYRRFSSTYAGAVSACGGIANGTEDTRSDAMKAAGCCPAALL